MQEQQWFLTFLQKPRILSIYEISGKGVTQIFIHLCFSTSLHLLSTLLTIIAFPVDKMVVKKNHLLMRFMPMREQGIQENWIVNHHCLYSLWNYQTLSGNKKKNRKEREEKEKKEKEMREQERKGQGKELWPTKERQKLLGLDTWPNDK